MTIGLGTFVSIEATAPAGILSPHAALDRACEVFERIEVAMHPTRAGSDLAAIAHAAPGAAVTVREETAELLEFVRQLWLASGGCFDPCLPDQPGRFGDLDLSVPQRVVRRRASIALDLGGVAKGFAIDLAVASLRASGCSSGIVNAGGDLRLFGAGARAIPLRVNDTIAGEITLENEALAVSAPRSSSAPSEHRGFYSPLTGEALRGFAVAVRAPTATVADALTKCAIVCEPDRFEQLRVRYGADTAALTSHRG